MNATAPEPAAVMKVIARILDEDCKVPADIEPGTRLREDLGLDSIQATTLAAEIENHYRIILDEHVEAPPETVADLISLVRRRLAEDGDAR